VKTQVWTAMTVYVLVAIVKKRLGLALLLYPIFQVLSITLFEKVPLPQLLTHFDHANAELDTGNQLTYFDL